MNKSKWILLYFVSRTLDITTTTFGMLDGHTEANPFLANIIDTHGLLAFVLINTVFSLTVGLLASKPIPRAVLLGVKMFTVLSLFIGISNLIIIL